MGRNVRLIVLSRATEVSGGEGEEDELCVGKAVFGRRAGVDAVWEGGFW